LIARRARPTKVSSTRQPDNSAARLVSARLGGSKGWELGAASSRQIQVRESTTVLSLGFFDGHTLLSQFACQIIWFHYGRNVSWVGSIVKEKDLAKGWKRMSRSLAVQPDRLLDAIRWFIRGV